MMVTIFGWSPSSIISSLSPWGGSQNNLISKCRMETLQLSVRLIAAGALKISNRVSIRALQLSNFETFRALKLSNWVL